MRHAFKLGLHIGPPSHTVSLRNSAVVVVFSIFHQFTLRVNCFFFRCNFYTVNGFACAYKWCVPKTGRVVIHRSRNIKWTASMDNGVALCMRNHLFQWIEIDIVKCRMHNITHTKKKNQMQKSFNHNRAIKYLENINEIHFCTFTAMVVHYFICGACMVYGILNTNRYPLWEIFISMPEHMHSTFEESSSGAATNACVCLSVCVCVYMN